MISLLSHYPRVETSKQEVQLLVKKKKSQDQKWNFLHFILQEIYFIATHFYKMT